MKILKVRRVGNSNVVTIPREHESEGFEKDASVLVTRLPSGELRVVPTRRLREMVREYGRRAIADNRAALQLLEDYDRGNE